MLNTMLLDMWYA